MGSSKYRLLVALLALPLITHNVSLARDTKTSQEEQTFFPSDTPDEVYIRKPISLPDTAIDTLKRSETGVACLEIQHQFDKDWVMGSVVHLGDAGETGIVVMATVIKDARPNYCMLGAHTTTYWVLQKGEKGYQLLLETKASALSVEKPRQKGYSIIKTYIVNYADTVTVSYRMDAGKYQEYRRKVTTR